LGDSAFVIHVEPKNRAAADKALRDAGAPGRSGRPDRRHPSEGGGEIAPLARPTPATLLAPARWRRSPSLAKAQEPDVIIVNAHLTPVQQRNLEKAGTARCWTAPP
jgi:GTP-binding protein HflX